MKIRSKDGSVIDLENIRKEQVFIGNPYAVDHAILIKHNIALLDALEAALSAFVPQSWAYGAVRQAAGVVEES